MVEKKVKGRKRHIVVDILGLPLAVVVHVSNIHSAKSGSLPVGLALEKYPTLLGVSADLGYRKTFEEAMKDFGIGCYLTEKIAPHTF